MPPIFTLLASPWLILTPDLPFPQRPINVGFPEPLSPSKHMCKLPLKLIVLDFFHSSFRNHLSLLLCAFPKPLSPSNYPSKLLLKSSLFPRFHSSFHNHLQLGMSFPSPRRLVSTHPRSYWSSLPLNFTHHVWQLHHNFEKLENEIVQEFEFQRRNC
jgi:hypothetical protein